MRGGWWCQSGWSPSAALASELLGGKVSQQLGWPPTDGQPGEPDEVVLLDPAGNPTGRADRVAVHGRHTPLHLAFSTYLFNSRGEILITRRALSKLTWAGVWTNSCCGHPRPGEPIEAAAERRIREELGLHVTQFVSVAPDFAYRATDASGIVENEICPVFAAFGVAGEPNPDPDEVAEWAWVPWEQLVSAAAATPAVYSPWAVAQIPLVVAYLAPETASGDATVDADALVADVDALLRTELDALADEWTEAIGPLGRDVLGADLPQWLAELLIGRGKRLRARLAYLGFIAAGGRHGSPAYRQLTRLAAALETLQLFALVHDDVMDQSPARRGRPAAHVEATRWHQAAAASGDADRFGTNLAVLLGDLAHVMADRLVDELPRQVRSDWYALWVELIAGQRADLTGAAARRRDLLQSEVVAQLKSGRYTVTRPLQLGATIAQAGPEVLAALQAYGDHIGRAFALRDDYLGVWGDPQVTGKPVTLDLAEGKATVPLALAQERLTGPVTELLGRVGTSELTADDVARLATAMQDAGIAAEVEARIATAVTAGLAALADAPITAPGAAGLRSVASAIAWRDA